MLTGSSYSRLWFIYPREQVKERTKWPSCTRRLEGGLQAGPERESFYVFTFFFFLIREVCYFE